MYLIFVWVAGTPFDSTLNHLQSKMPSTMRYSVNLMTKNPPSLKNQAPGPNLITIQCLFQIVYQIIRIFQAHIKADKPMLKITCIKITNRKAGNGWNNQ